MHAFLLLLIASLPLRLWPSVEPNTEVLATERREGYVCKLIEYNAVGEERVQSFLLVPDTADAAAPCPALVLLHDHGARFDGPHHCGLREQDTILDYFGSLWER